MKEEACKLLVRIFWTHEQKSAKRLVTKMHEFQKNMQEASHIETKSDDFYWCKDF